MKLAVVGSRNYPSMDEVIEYLDALSQEVDIECIVSGGARGVDREAEGWGKRNGLPVVSFRPKRLRGGRYGIERVTFTRQSRSFDTLPGSYPSFAAAAFVRNGFIVDFADEVVAFHFGDSHGTADSVARARIDEKLRDVIGGRR